MQKVFEALSSPIRRKILAYLAHAELTAGDIAARFEISKPSISQHLTILDAAGLVSSEKRGQFVYYRQIEGTLLTTMTSFLQEACPIGRPLRRESKGLAQRRKKGAASIGAPKGAR